MTALNALTSRLLVALFLSAGFMTAIAQEAKPGAAAAATVVKVACVGDSITAGYGAGGPDSYPNVLGKLLGASYQVANFGVSGATLMKSGDKPYWKEAAFTKAAEFAPDVVVLMLGTNDSKPQNWKNKDSFAGDYRAMVDHFTALPNHPKVYVCLPAPVYGAGNFAITNPPVKDEILPLIRKVAADAKAPIIDVNAALSERPELFPDTVHPNAAGYKLLAETIAKALAPPAQ